MSTAGLSQPSVFRTGFILSGRADSVWFLGLPFFAVLAALASQRWLPFVAIASVNLWVTYPHHFVSWVRAYGLSEDWERYRTQLIVGPLFIVTMSLIGVVWAPVTMFALGLLWDTQHTIMQQHGFARIYDFKARTGAPATRSFDLTLHWVLYGNLFITAPVFSTLWIREAYRWHVSITPEFVHTLQAISWTVTVTYLIVYFTHIVVAVRRGHAINPIKYLFIGASYFLWYFTAWHTASVLVMGIAHRLMHGSQYIVIVYAYLRRKAASAAARTRDFGLRITSSAKKYIFACALYALLFQLLLAQPFEDIVFGTLDFAPLYEAIPSFGLKAMDPAGSYQLFAAAIIESFALVHFYVDSFIWKVRDERVQKGL